MTQQAPGPKPKAKTFDDAFEEVSASEAERRMLGGEPGEEERKPHPLEEAAENPQAALTEVQVPDWFVAPSGLHLPNKELCFMRFRAEWTDRPEKGDHHCLLWPLNVGDEKLALDRTMGKATRTLAELAMQSIRAADGKRADWTMTLFRKEPGNYFYVPHFWDEIGAKCRQMIINWYSKSHALNAEQLAEFFLKCFVVARVVSG